MAPHHDVVDVVFVDVLDNGAGGAADDCLKLELAVVVGRGRFEFGFGLRFRLLVPVLPVARQRCLRRSIVAGIDEIEDSKEHDIVVGMVGDSMIERFGSLFGPVIRNYDSHGRTYSPPAYNFAGRTRAGTKTPLYWPRIMIRMGLDVTPPDPPALPEQDTDEYEDVDVQGTDYRRDELETFLHNGAWEEAFERWAAETDLEERAYDIADDLGMFEAFDFFWDDFADRVGYHAPGIPEDWKERELHPELSSWETVSGINAAMAEFGDVVSRTLKEEYVDWEADYDAPDDLPDF